MPSLCATMQEQYEAGKNKYSINTYLLVLNYAGQQYKAGENKYPINTYLLVL